MLFRTLAGVRVSGQAIKTVTESLSHTTVQLRLGGYERTQLKPLELKATKCDMKNILGRLNN